VVPASDRVVDDGAGWWVREPLKKATLPTEAKLVRHTMDYLNNKIDGDL